MQDFPGMVDRFGLDGSGYFNAHLPARLDLFVRPNYEAHFFVDQAGIERSLADPLASCGLLTDPVAKRRFHPAAGTRPERFEDVDFYFESEATRRRFREIPESYFLPGYRMEEELDAGMLSPASR